MRWLAKNALGEVLLPPCNLLLLQFLGLALWRKRPKLGYCVMAAATLGLYLLSVPTVGVAAIESLERTHPALDLEDPKLAARADAIVVLGGGRTLGAQDFDGHAAVSVSSFMRLRYGMAILRKTGKPLLLTGGAPGNHGPTEADLMATALREEFGAEAKWVENRAENTAENAEYSHRILAAQGVRRIFLVTSAWHMPRAERAFTHAGFEVVTAPTAFLSDEAGGGTILGWIPSAKGLELSFTAWHEGVGALWYRLRGVD